MSLGAWCQSCRALIREYGIGKDSDPSMTGPKTHPERRDGDEGPRSALACRYENLLARSGARRAACLAVSGLALSLSGGWSVGPAFAQSAPPTSSQPSSVPTPAPRSVPSSFADLANRLLPSVVNVSTSAVLKPSKNDDKGPDSSDPDGPQVPPFQPGSRWKSSSMIT